MFPRRMSELVQRMLDAGVEVGLITDEDNVYYLTGYYNYLHMEFGRPTILVVDASGESLLITPSMELDMAEAAARVDRIAPWNDGLGEEWRAELPGVVKDNAVVGIEHEQMPPTVRGFVDGLVPDARIRDLTSIIADMRMVKSPEELTLARHAGEVAGAMMDAGRAVIGSGVPEYEVALAVSIAGTRRAAALLENHYDDDLMSPNTHFLQIMASGRTITMPHRRPSTRVMQHGDPVFLCLCGMTDFHRFKLGFDRTFWIGAIKDDLQRTVYETAVASQRAALSTLRAGVTAEQVHAAYAGVIEEAGYAYPFRCGRATGFSYLERPQLVAGDKTVLKPGMVVAVDGSVSIPGRFRAQVGDSFIVTEDGYEPLTQHPNSIEQLIL